TYLISKAKVNVAKKNFSAVKNDYEIYLESGSIIEEVANRNPTDLIKFDFVRIENISQYEKDSTLDVVGMVINVDDIQQITTRTTQKNINKRDITIADQSEYQIILTLWGQTAEKYGPSILNTVIACKNVRVGDFAGRNLSVFNGTSFLVDVDIKEPKELRDWYTSRDEGRPFASLSSSGSVAIDKNEPKKTLAQAKNEKLGHNERTDYFSTKATILFIKKEGVSYPACPTCKKKVLEDGDEWRCEKCSRNYPEPDHRYIMTISVADFSDYAWFQCFNESAIVIMGREAKELIKLCGENVDLYEECFDHACLKSFVFRCRAKTEIYNEQTRIRYTVTGIAPVDYAARARELYKDIEIMRNN
ncbi:6693_t:CDS:2, partial [Cetraspora pellucida]